MTKKPYGTVLIRGVKILDYLADSEVNKNLTEISLHTQMTASTTLKILDTLLMMGIVSRDDVTKEYGLGPRLVKYANKYVNDSLLLKAALPHLKQLNDEVNETVHLGIQYQNEVMYLEKLEPKNQTIFMTSKIGITRPLYSSAMGKAILAKMDRRSVENYINQTDFIKHTGKTITDEDKLLEELEAVKKQGVAFDDEEMENDIFCIGTAVDLGDNQYGAISISMPKYRASYSRVQELVSLIKVTKGKIESEMGGK